MALVKIIFADIFQLAVKISGETLTLDFMFSADRHFKKVEKNNTLYAHNLIETLEIKLQSLTKEESVQNVT